MANDWQLGCKDIKMRIVNLYYSECWHDCKFLVGTKANQSVITAHKVVLATASPVFSAMFFGKMSETSDQICIQDIEPDTFNEMLRYIYTDNIDISSFVDGCALYYAAKKYMLLHLMTQCSEYLLSNLTVKHCCYGYEFAKMFDEKKLLEACMELIETNTSEVLSDGLEDASLDTLKMIYSLDKLTISSEMELFKAVQHYVEMHQMQEDVRKEKLILTTMLHNGISLKCGVQPSVHSPVLPLLNFGFCVAVLERQTFISLPEEGNGLNLKNGIAFGLSQLHAPQEYEMEQKNPSKSSFKNGEGSNPSNHSSKEPTTISNLLQLIRFLSMEPEEFLKVPAQSPLLSQDEKLKILLKIGNLNSDLPMPEGFSTSTEKRNKHIPVDRSRKSCAFTFKVPECKALNVGDCIYSPTFYVMECSWTVGMELLEQNILNVFIKFNRLPDSTVDVTLELGLVSKTCENFYEKFIIEVTKNKLHRQEIGHFVAWNDAINNYMDDGCLHFELKFKIEEN